MRFESDYAPADEATILRCEEMLRRPIPEPYRSWLKVHNGGAPERSAFTWVDEHGDRCGARVLRFLCVGAPRDEDGVERNVGSVYRDRVPADLFPIATEQGSNLILLGTSGDRAGRIYYWDHNWEMEESDPDKYRNVHPLADSFESFLAMLTD